MGLFTIPELNTRLGTYRAYHLAAIVLYVDAINYYRNHTKTDYRYLAFHPSCPPMILVLREVY
jgi:hypothetical protein